MSRSRPDLSETEGGVPALLSGGHRLANLKQHLLVSISAILAVIKMVVRSCKNRSHHAEVDQTQP